MNRAPKARQIKTAALAFQQEETDGPGILKEATVSYGGARSLNAMHTLAETTTAYALGWSGAVRFTTDQKQAVGDDQRGAEAAVRERLRPSVRNVSQAGLSLRSMPEPARIRVDGGSDHAHRRRSRPAKTISSED